jgi:hypothetical protein
MNFGLPELIVAAVAVVVLAIAWMAFRPHAK